MNVLLIYSHPKKIVKMKLEGKMNVESLKVKKRGNLRIFFLQNLKI